MLILCFLEIYIIGLCVIYILVYLDIGNSDSSTVEFAFGTTSSTSRQWDVKVAQIPCGASYGYVMLKKIPNNFVFVNHSKSEIISLKSIRPPDDCLQWSTGITGRITTFNFLNSGGSHLNNQK